VRGLSDAETAERRKHPSYIRTFLRLVMVKMDVASRSEIITLGYWRKKGLRVA